MEAFNSMMLIAIFLLVISVWKIGCISSEAESYLAKYGYNDKNARGLFSISSNVARLQTFANLPVTGILDQATLNQMKLPRCSVMDPLVVARFNPHKTKWQKNLLTWKFDGNSRTLKRVVVLFVLEKAFNMWSQYANLDFKEITSDETPDIKITFRSGIHDGPNIFDGKGGALAHAFYPLDNKGISGDVHFDNAEDFTYNSEYGHDILRVATHEIGHSLGLQHSNIKNSIMYPWYVGAKDVALTQDDIEGIQSIYGSRKQTPREFPCPDVKVRVTAVYNNRRINMLVAFTNNKQIYFIEKGKGIKYGPAPIEDIFQHAKTPAHVDAAYYIKKDGGFDQTVLFSGETYYIFQHFDYVSGPHKMHSTDTTTENPLKLKFPSWVGRIDAVITWNRNGRTYFFSGEYYWGYDHKLMKFDKGYPRVTQSKWKGVPQSIDAAYSSEKGTVFLAGLTIYNIDDWSLRTTQGYPKHIACKFYNCGGESFKDKC